MSSLTDFSMQDDASRECPFPHFQRMRLEQPVCFIKEFEAFYISRYADVRYVKKHPELFTNQVVTNAGRGGEAKRLAEAYRAEHGWKRVHTLQRTDPPLHTTYRKLINHTFTASRIRSMTPYIETCVNDLIDRFIDAGSCDFVWDFAIPLPCTVIADQLGVPREKIWELKAWSDAMLAPGGGFVDEASAIGCAQKIVAAQQFFAQVIEARREVPKDDIISDLVHTQIEDPKTGEQRHLDMYELMDMLDQLLTGGNETTTNALGSALMLLLQRPGTMERLRDDARLLRNFIEETLRYETPVLHLWRMATKDTEVGGVPIPKGSVLALGYASANRDEAVFEDGETFDVARKKPGAHLAFGSGPHHCPGAALARQEIFSTFTVLLNRLENLSLVDPEDQFGHVPHSFLRGLEHLRIRFDVRAQQRYLPNASAY